MKPAFSRQRQRLISWLSKVQRRRPPHQQLSRDVERLFKAFEGDEGGDMWFESQGKQVDRRHLGDCLGYPETSTMTQSQPWVREIWSQSLGRKRQREVTFLVTRYFPLEGWHCTSERDPQHTCLENEKGQLRVICDEKKDPINYLVNLQLWRGQCEIKRSRWKKASDI